MNEIMKKERSFDKLGLPPIELAESTCNRQNNGFYMNKCVFLIQKLKTTILLLVLGAGLYVLLLRLLDIFDSQRATEIIVIRDAYECPNITLTEDDVELSFQIKNNTVQTSRRKKRNTIEPTHNKDDYVEEYVLSDAEMQTAREIIIKHDVLCQKGDIDETCKKLTKQFKETVFGTKVNDDVNNYINDLYDIHTFKHLNSETAHTHRNTEAVQKREIVPIEKSQSILESVPRPQAFQTQQPDPCLERLLRQYNQAPNTYELHRPEYIAPNFDSQVMDHRARYFAPMSHPNFLEGREIEARKTILHPQDVDIFMSLLTPKPQITSNKKITAGARDTQCPEGTVPCINGESCINEKQWCDGHVDCSDVSDEAECDCKSRVDRSRLCDGYFDCPFGEDEMGCFGCSDSTFSCLDVERNSQSTCFTKEQRCDNIEHCPNHRDELECNMLAPSLLKKPLFAVSNTEGFLHRNLKGDWYAVCHNPYMWAHDTCRRETGLIIRPPFTQRVPVDPLMKVNYLSMGPGGILQTSETCFNSSAVYVTCPDLLCGTRVPSTSQLLRENAAIENRLFGRNKRFLLDHPYRFMFYGKRQKRSSYNYDILNYLRNRNDANQYSTPWYTRNMRSESRVVGGKPSQPTSWPWTVAIYRNGMFHCGGVIITQNWVISAAHCVHKFWDHYYEVQAGMLRRFSFSPQEQNHQVTHVIVNQQYKQEDMKNDLSLLRVEPIIQFSRWVRPICLPGPDTAGADWLWGPSPGTVCTAVGWGATIEHGPDPDHLREVEVPIWDKCKHKEDRAGKEICAGFSEGGKDACQGDSGGPLLCRNPSNSQQWYLAGIVSHGDGCARKGEPGVYTRVSLFVKWIKHHITAKSLPIVKPLQECPGFKCKSGISKCIYSKRICDQIIDCLGGEDELDCEFVKSTTTLSDNEFISEMFRTHEKENQTETNRVTKGVNIDDNTSQVIENSEITESGTTEAVFVDDKYITSERTTMQIDLKYASTLELPYSSKSEESNSDSHEMISTALPEINKIKHNLLHTSTINITSNEDLSTTTLQTTTEENRGDTYVINDLKNKNSISQSIIDQETSSNELFENTFKVHMSDMENVTDKFTRDDNNNMTTESTTNDLNSQFSEYTMTTTDDTIEEYISLDSNDNEKMNHSDLIMNLSNSNLNVTDSKEKSEGLYIELLPTSNMSFIQNTESTEENIVEKSLNSSSTEKKPPKTLMDFESKHDIVKKVEDIVFSQKMPAKIRRKHLPLKEFQCGKISQVISYHLRCDNRADCEDGTDELRCTCIDYLSTINEKFICDGELQCADGQDEIDCFSCPEDHFLCKKSETCIPLKNVCDGVSECPQDDDELDCFALSNGKELQYEVDERPQINLEGFVTKRHQNQWHIVCEDKLTIEHLEQEAINVCQNLGFSSASSYSVKYINIKENDNLLPDKRSRRQTATMVPVHFAYKNDSNQGNSTEHFIIQEPQLLKEQCIPNVTKTCKSLYVFCDRTLFDDKRHNKQTTHETETTMTHMWPWIAKVYVEGNYRCVGVLVDLSWVLVSHGCLWETSTHSYISVVLGSHKTLKSIKGPYEQIYKVDAKKDLYRSKIVLLHLKSPAFYSNMVKPMIVSSTRNHLEKNSKCVTVGQLDNNETITIFLDETNENCSLHNICFKRKINGENVSNKPNPHREWAGIISCHTEQGWAPVASFIDVRGECGIGEHIIANEIDNLKYEMKHYSSKKVFSDSMEHVDIDHCEGTRCGRGTCLSLEKICDGVRQCEDGTDESEESCHKKREICIHDAFHTGCGCSSGQMKCRNGNCISKELFRDGRDDCGDGTDEPGHTTCSDYLARVMPSRLCDGILHCHDRSDEDPSFCKCYAKKSYSCSKKSNQCVALDVVCDGVRDCPNGEDEKTCIGLSAPEGTQYGTGQVIVRSYGVWHSKCYPTQNHTKSELEAICKELGFISGHAKEIKGMKVLHKHNALVLDPFREIVLNNNTVIKMRNTHEPLAKPIFNKDMNNCYPVFIECY